MKSLFVLLSMVTMSFLWQEPASSNKASSAPAVQEFEKTADKSKSTEPVDITAQVKSNNDLTKFAGPPKTFRQGHATPAKLDPKAITLKKDGFEIQLPSGAQVPTLTFYEGRLYSSGGFHSKQFYCFEAISGELKWAIDLDDDGPSSAVCEDGICVFNTESCTIFAVNAETGSHLWSWWLGDPLMTTPMISDGKVYTSYPASGRYEGSGGPGHGGGLGGGGGYGALQNQQPAQNLNQQSTLQPKVQAPQQKASEQTADEQAAVGPRRRVDEAKPKNGLTPPKGQSHVMACFDLKTGKIIWQKWIDSDVMSAPVADGKEVYATTFAGTVYRFDGASGKVLSAVKSRATSAPTIVKGNINFSSRADGDNESASESIGWYSKSFKRSSQQYNLQKADYLDAKTQQQSALKSEAAELDAGNGFATGAPTNASPLLALANVGQNNVSSLQGFQGSRGLYLKGRSFCCPGDKIICNSETGKELWSIKLKGDMKKLGGMLAAPPIHAGGQILVSTLNGEVLQLEPEKGEVVATHKIGHQLRFPPIVNEGRIYVGTQNGKVICIDTKDTKLTGWTTWGGNSAHNKTD